MSDAFRESAGEKFHDAVKPNAQKTWTEQKGDQIKGTADQLASHAQPQSEKSGTQKVIDAVTPDNQGTSHHHVANNDTRQGPLDKAKAALTPDAQKPATTQAHDNIVGKTDNAIGEATPHENKTFIQKVKDAVNPHSTA